MKSMKKISLLFIITLSSFFILSNSAIAAIVIQGPNISPNTLQAGKENTLNYSFTLTGNRDDARNTCNKPTESNEIYWELKVGRAGSPWKQVTNAFIPFTDFPLQNPVKGTFRFTPKQGDTSESFQVVLFCVTADEFGNKLPSRQFSGSGAVTVDVVGQTQGAAKISFDVLQPQPGASGVREVNPGQSVAMSFKLNVTEDTSDINSKCGQVSFIKWVVAMFPATQNDNFTDNIIRDGQIDTVDFGTGKTFSLDFQKTVAALNQDFVIKARLFCSGSTVLTTSQGIRFNAGGAGAGGGTGGGGCDTPGQPKCKPGETKTYSFNIPNPLKGGASDFTSLVKIIAQWIFNLAIPIAVAMIVYSGILFLTAAGEPAKVTKAKEVLKYAVIGLAIILIGSGFVTLIQSILELGGTTPPPAGGPPPGPGLPPGPGPAGPLYGCTDKGYCVQVQDPNNVPSSYTEVSGDASCNNACSSSGPTGDVGSLCKKDRDCQTDFKCKDALCQRANGNFGNEPCNSGRNCGFGNVCDKNLVIISDGRRLGTCVAK